MRLLRTPHTDVMRSFFLSRVIFIFVSGTMTLEEVICVSLDSTAASTTVLVLTNRERKMPENATREFLLCQAFFFWGHVSSCARNIIVSRLIDSMD